MTTTRPLTTLQQDSLPVAIYESNEAMGQAAAATARVILNQTIADKGRANIMLASANSQLSFLHALRQLDGINWRRVNVFHMDEFLGINPGHRASFPLFLRQHFLDYVTAANFFPISGNIEAAQTTCRHYEALLRQYPVDLAVLGFGENGHIAFNDPPYADFNDPVWLKVVELDEVSRQQQFGEGHFDSLAETPSHAITLTIPALLAAQQLLCLVPEARKAEAVRRCLLEPVSEARPGSVLRTVTHAQLFLDTDSARYLA